MKILIFLLALLNITWLIAEDEKPASTEENVESVNDPTLDECLELSGDKLRWTKVVKTIHSSRKDGAEQWLELMIDHVKEQDDYKKALQENDTTKCDQIRDAYIKENSHKYVKCIGYSFVMAQREEGFESGRKKKSGDGRLSCYNHGYHTMDYEACGKLVDAYDMSSVAQVGLQAIQVIDFQNTASSAGKEYSQNASNPTSALEAQKKTIEKQADMANVQAGFHAAKVAAIWKLYDLMPTEESLADNCGKIFTQDAMDKIRNDYKIEADLESLCTLTASGQVNFLGNSSVKDDIKRIMAEETMNAVAKTAQGALLNKQAKKINTAIDQVNAFDPSSVVSVPETPDLCLSNPNDASCKLADTRSDVDLAGNGFTVSGDWGGTNASTSNRAEEDGTENSTTPSTNNNGPSAIGAVIADNTKADGFASPPPAAGVVESGGSNSGGGGGGGGSGAVGLPSGGGSGSGGSGGPVGEEKVSTKLAYTGGESGGRYAGTTLAKKTSQDSKQNPFDDLFKKKGPSKGEVLNFRDPASNGDIAEKDGKSLFELISNRYRVSQEKKRLLEYEAVPAS